MADIKTFAKERISAQQIERKFTEFAQAQNPGASIGVAGTGPTTQPAATASPPVQAEPAKTVDPLDFPHVHPGDLITADFINDLIDVVIAIDTRLQRIEILLAPLVDRETKRLQAQASASPPVAEGKP